MMLVLLIAIYPLSDFNCALTVVTQQQQSHLTAMIFNAEAIKITGGSGSSSARKTHQSLVSPPHMA